MTLNYIALLHIYIYTVCHYIYVYCRYIVNLFILWSILGVLFRQMNTQKVSTLEICRFLVLKSHPLHNPYSRAPRNCGLIRKPHIWKHKKCFKPPTRDDCHLASRLFFQVTFLHNWEASEMWPSLYSYGPTNTSKWDEITPAT